MKKFIQMIKSQETIELMRDRNAFVLLAQIACRAKRTNEFSVHHLDKGEALIGDYKKIGLTRGQYREATNRLTKYGFITIRTTNKGTIAKLINSEVFDINEEVEQSPAQPSNHHQTTTNNNDKNEKKTHTSARRCPYEPIVGLYNEMLPALPSVQKITNNRKKYLKARWDTSDKTQNLDWWKDFFTHISKSDFLMGLVKDNFRASFDWIINESNFHKIIEGNYHK
jgi:hypothetical protein